MVVSKIFGPNIKRIKKKFVCILIKEKSIESGIEIIKKNLLAITEQLDLGEDRLYLSL